MFAVPRVVGGIGGAVVGMAGGAGHSLVITTGGRVLVFGGGWNIEARGGGGRGSGTVPTAINGVTMGEGDGTKGGESVNT